jgi:uncharacterized protein YcbK (DUF882 family)
MKSKYFTLNEMLRSQTATRLKITEQFNPPAEIIHNLELLCEHILDPLREKVGPIRVSSGYRCPRLNTQIKGSKTSQHMKGQAADISGINCTNAELFEQIKKLKLPFDQMIWEFGTSKEPDWVHVSYGVMHRRQILYVD